MQPTHPLINTGTRRQSWTLCDVQFGQCMLCGIDSVLFRTVQANGDWKLDTIGWVRDSSEPHNDNRLWERAGKGRPPATGIAGAMWNPPV